MGLNKLLWCQERFRMNGQQMHGPSHGQIKEKYRPLFMDVCAQNCIFDRWCVKTVRRINGHPAITVAANPGQKTGVLNVFP